MTAQLSGYLGSLGEYHHGPSAAGLQDVLRMRDLLAAAPVNADAFEVLVEHLLVHFDKNALIKSTGECGRVIELPRGALRG